MKVRRGPLDQNIPEWLWEITSLSLKVINKYQPNKTYTKNLRYTSGEQYGHNGGELKAYTED